MSAARDQNDRLRDGTLPSDPSADAVALRAVVPARSRVESLRFDKSMPADIFAEQSLLAALLWSGSYAPDTLRADMVADLLDRPEMFAAEEHRAIYAAIRALSSQAKPADQVAVHSKLVEAGTASVAGGMNYIEELVDSASSTSEPALRAYAETIRDGWIRREMIGLSRKLEIEARSPKAKPEDLMSSAHSALEKVAEHATVKASFTPIAAVAASIFRDLQDKNKRASLRTGLRDLDKLAPLFLREVTIIAARTSLGKSVLAGQIAAFVGGESSEYAALYVSLEMSKEKLVRRAIASRAGVHHSKLRDGTFTPEEVGPITAATMEISRRQINFTDSISQSMMSIYTTAKELQNQLMRPSAGERPRKIGLIVIDTLPLVKPSVDTRGRGKNEQVAEASRGCRWLGQELDCHVIGIVQINRSAENGKDDNKVPRLHQLKDCGSLEEDADNVFILHREKDRYGQFKDMPAQLIVAKQRDGELGVIELDLDTRFMRFKDYDGPPTGYTPNYGDQE